jgi:nitroreductase
MAKIDILNLRRPEYKANPMFVKRWSQRAMSGEEIGKDKLMSLFETARWAPSAFNNQPWVFLYAIKNTSNWDSFFDLLNDSNKLWAKNAAALVVILSKKTFDYNGKPSPTHSFDTGAAWENLALQGSVMGLVVHGISGFDYSKARSALDVPDDYDIEAMVVIGKRGNIEDLPKELQERETPSGRKPVSEITIEGKFKR